MKISKARNHFIIFFITFFTFSGYNAGLAIMIGLGLDTTTLYSVPLRIITSLLMIYYIYNYHKYFKKNNISEGKVASLLIFNIFSIFYIIKILLTFGIFTPIIPYKLEWFEYIFYFLNFCVLPLLMYSAIEFNDNNKKIILDTLIFSGFVMAIVCIFEYKTTILSGHMGRLGSGIDAGDTLNPLALSYSASLTIMLCIYQIIYKKGLMFKYKIYTFVNILLNIILFLLGSSRGAILAIVLCLPLFFIYSKTKAKLKLILIFGISVPLIIYGAAISGSYLLYRVQNTEKHGDINRTILWDAAKKEFWQHPVFGGRIEVSGGYPHDIFLEILMATGIIGMLLFLFVFTRSFRRIASLCKRDYSNIFIFIVFIQGLAQYMVSGGIYSAILLFFPMGLIFASYNTKVKTIGHE